MSIGATIVRHLEATVNYMDIVAARMPNEDDRNAYRLFDPDNADGMLVAVTLYDECCRSHGMQLGKMRTEALNFVDDLEDDWKEIFDAVGQRLNHHDALKKARDACDEANDRLRAFLNADVASPPPKDAKDVIRRFITALSGLSDAMCNELAESQPDVPIGVKKEELRKLAVSLMKGFYKYYGVTYTASEEAVRKVLRNDFDSVGLKSGRTNFHSLRCDLKYKMIEAATREDLERHGLVKSQREEQ